MTNRAQYPWTEQEKRDMKPGTPLVLLAEESFVLFLGPSPFGGATVLDAQQRKVGCTWAELAPATVTAAPPLSEQERELFEARCSELTQVRAALHEAREKHTAYAKTLSHVLQENERLEKRVAELQSQVDTLKTALLVEKNPRVKALVDEYRRTGKMPQALENALEQYDRDERARRAAAVIDESGEPSAGDYVAVAPDGGSL